MTERLVAWLHGTPVLAITRTANFRVAIEWEAGGIERWGRASRVLSISLPLGSPTSVRDDRGLNFFSNLLPDGPVLNAMAQMARVPSVDTFGLLQRFGSECAGAVTLLREGEVPASSSQWAASPVSLEELARLIDALPTTPFGAVLEQDWTPSLSGFQGKVLLGRSADGAWSRPLHGAPSTWILKPDREHEMAQNEATCLRLAREMGLPVPDVELLEINGAQILAIRRYDRDESRNHASRLHQEDACQATGTAPMQKYEHAGGPSLKQIARVLRDYGDLDATVALFRRVIFNAAIGNADAHAKNFSLLHDAQNSSITLAPVYDVLSTIALAQRPDFAGTLHPASTQMGQRVNGVENILAVTRSDLIAEAVSWGVRSATAARIVSDDLDTLAVATQASTDDEVVLKFIREQLARVGTSEH